MDNETISFQIKMPRGKETLTWHLGMISVEDDQKFLQKFIDLADDGEKRSKEYQIYVDALATWSTQMPTITNGKVDKDKKPIASPIGKGEDIAAAVKEYFGAKDAAKGWIADYSVRAFRSQLQPDVSFL